MFCNRYEKVESALLGYNSGITLILHPILDDIREVIAIDRDTNETKKFSIFGSKVRRKESSCDQSCPQFIKELDNNLRMKIETMVGFKVNQKSGYLIVFDIDGQPMYCIQDYPSSNVSQMVCSIIIQILINKNYYYFRISVQIKRKFETFG